jgi:hypothetical protein
MHDPEHNAAALKRAAAAAVRSCGETLSWQFDAWPAGAGACAGVVLGQAQAVVLAEVFGPEAVAGVHDGGGAALARALREPTRPGERMVVVLLEEGAAVVPVTPLTARGGGRA